MAILFIIMEYKLIMENWRGFLTESKAESMIMQLDGLLSMDEEFDGVMVKRLMNRAIKLAKQTIKVEGEFPKIEYSSQPRWAWATYYGKTNTMVFHTDTWTGWEKRFKDYLKQIIIYLLNQKHKDNFQRISTPDAVNTIKDSEAETIKTLVVEMAAIILSFTVVHELVHANQMVKMGSDDYENPKFNAQLEAEASNMEDEHHIRMEPVIKKAAEKLAYTVYLKMVEFGIEQEEMETVYNQILDLVQNEVDDMHVAIHNDWDYYDSARFPSEKDIKSDKKYVATYKVKKGDNLYKISKRFGIDFKDILKINRQLKDPNKIYVGQKIRIPNDAYVPPRKTSRSTNVAQNNLPATGQKTRRR